MIDINDHCEDPMLIEFMRRRAQGNASPLDRANTALLNAQQSACVQSEGDDCDRERAQAHVDRVALAASAVAIAEKQGEQAVAAEFAKVAESEALTLDSFAYVKVEGLRRHEIHGI